MSLPTAIDWHKYRQHVSMDPDAAERGRLMTAHLIANDPEARKRGEDAFGPEFMARMYPEAYRVPELQRMGLGRLLDRVRSLTPW